MESPLVENNEAGLVALARTNYSSNLSEAELRIIHDSVRPGPAKPLPGDRAELRHVRADFLRWLLNDARAAVFMDKDGLQVVAATIDGKVDLDNSHIPYDLNFSRCVFKGDIGFALANARAIYIGNSTSLGNVTFEGATISGGLSLEDGFQSQGSVTMYGTRIVGDLSMKGATLLGKDKQFSLDNAEVSGIVYFVNFKCAGPVWMLNTKFGGQFIATGANFGSTVTMTGASVEGDLTLGHVQSVGTVNLDHATVAGSISLDGAHLEGKQTSLSLRSTTVVGDVYLMPDFHASGSVNLWQAVIKQGLWVNEAELAELDCSDAQIGADLLWAGIINPERTKLNLAHANVKGFRDVKKSWPAPGNLSVVGFVYEDISLEVPIASGKIEGTNPDDRIAWLMLQSNADRIASQPWIQLAKYVQAQNNPAGAKKVLDMMKRMQAKNALVFRYEEFVENPTDVLIPMGLFWIVGSVIFWRARRMKAMAPTDKDAYDHFSKHDNAPLYYVPFSPVVYTLENVLPVVKLGQDDAWAPDPQSNPAPRQGWKRWLPQLSYNWLALLRWLLIVLGWMLAIVLAGVIGSLFKS
jgi:hypothetical protein